MHSFPSRSIATAVTNHQRAVAHAANLTHTHSLSLMYSVNIRHNGRPRNQYQSNSTAPVQNERSCQAALQAIYTEWSKLTERKDALKKRDVFDVCRWGGIPSKKLVHCRRKGKQSQHDYRETKEKEDYNAESLDKKYNTLHSEAHLVSRKEENFGTGEGTTKQTQGAVSHTWESELEDFLSGETQRGITRLVVTHS